MPGLACIYLTANQCFAVQYGDMLVSISGQTLFTSRKELRFALKQCGLVIKDANILPETELKE